MSLTKDGFYKQIGGVTGDNSYVLLAGGGHQKFGNESSYIPISNGTKNVNLNADLLDGYHYSSFSFTSHTHKIKLGATEITVPASGETPTAVQAIIGPFAINTQASSDKAFSIQRESSAEGVQHWVDDGQYHIDYTNDETSSSIHIRVINTDTEAPHNPRQTTDYHYYLDCYGNIYPGSNNTGSIGTSSYKWANMYATTFHGALEGNASSATKLQTARTINGVSFDGTTNITIAPSLPISGNTIAVKVGNQTSGYITVPYASSAGALTSVIGEDKLPPRLRAYSQNTSTNRNVDTLNRENGFYWSNSGTLPANVGDIDIITVNANTSYGHQLGFKFSGNGTTGESYDGRDIYTRIFNNGSYKPWYVIYTAGNTGWVYNDQFRYEPHSKRIICLKTSDGWNQQIYSKQSYIGNCSFSFKPANKTGIYMIGLNTDPTSSASYESIDYCFYLHSNGNVYIYESNSNPMSYSGYNAGDEFKIEYADGYVRYYHNGVIKRTVTRSGSGAFYIDSCFYRASEIYDVEFRSMPQAINHIYGTDNTPANAMLHSGPSRPDNTSGNTWLFVDDAGGYTSTWGIFHNQVDNRIEFYGAGLLKSYINLSTGKFYTGRAKSTAAYNNVISIFHDAYSSQTANSNTPYNGEGSWGISFDRGWSDSYNSVNSAGIYAYGTGSWGTGLVFRVKGSTSYNTGHDRTALDLLANGQVKAPYGFIGNLTGNISGNADTVDGEHSSAFHRNLGGGNYITITVGGDAATYYPVVIGSPSDYYPYQFVNITRHYSDTAPNSWNTSTHKGGLSMAIFWNGSSYWDGNGSGGEAFVVRLYQSYCTMVGGVDNCTSGKVVWLRGGGANYHIFSMNGRSQSATVYLSTYTDSASRSFAPRTTPVTPTVQWPGDIQNGAGYLRDRSNGTATYANYGASGLGLGSITWLTCWNGYELRAISKGELGGLTNVYQHTGNNVDYPLVWSNQNNTSTVQANQLHKSYADLVYNPANKEIKTWSFAPQGENTNRGIHFPGGAWINSIGTSIIFRNATIRFGGSGWDWNAWAGLNFDGNTTINIGMPNNSHWTANSNKTAGTIRTVSSKIEIFPDGNSNYGEGLRIHTASNGWTSLILCGTDNTGFNGTSANSWSLHTNGGNFYLNRGSSNGQQASRLWGRSSGYTVGNIDWSSYTLEVADVLRVQNGIVLGGYSTFGTHYITGAGGRIYFGGNFHIDGYGRASNYHIYLNHYVSTNVYMVTGGGKVGINTADPQTKLDIRGVDKVSMSMDSANSYRFATSFKGQLHLAHASHGSGTGLNDGYIDGITFGVGSASYAGIFVQNSGSYGSKIIFSTTDDYSYNKARMIINHSGYVGIGTMTPSYKLHVTGDIYANGGWLRVSGTQGLYFESYGGGWYMSDNNWVRTYNSKGVVATCYYASNWGSATYLLRSDGGAACFNYGSKNSANCSYVWGWAADNDYRLYATGSLSVNYANYSNWAHYLAPHYDGGDRSNPQQYFNEGIGVKVAMARYTSLGGTSMWADTLWINGYTGGDVPNMCALTFARNASPRFFISTQSNRATSYGTYYEVASAYNTYVTNGYGYILGNYITKLYPVASNPDNSHPGYGCRVFYSWNTGQAGNGSSGYSNGITIGSHPNDQAYGFQIVQNMWDDKLYFRRYNGGWQSWRTCYDNVYHPNADYATSAGNADTVDGYHANRFAFTYNSANYNGSSGLTMTDLVTGGVSNASHGMIYPATDNPVGSANWVHVWSQQWTIGTTSSWVSQIALGVQQGTGMWYRTTSGNVVGRGWTRVLDSSNYTSYVNNYYWANIKISTSSSTDTSPTFYHAYLKYYLYMQDSGGNYRAAIDRSGNSPIFGYGFGQAGYHVYYTGYSVSLNGGTSWSSTGNGIYINSSNNIGIGCNDPSYKLDISGNIRVRSGNQILIGTISKGSSDIYNGGIQLREATYSTTSCTDNMYDGPGITFHWGGWWVHKLNMHSNDIFWDNNRIWHSGNDGSGSGLDADLLDGYHASSFSLTSHNHDDRYLRLAGGWMDWTAQINFKGSGGSTSVYSRIGYATGTINGIQMHTTQTNALYICTNGDTSSTDNGGLAIDNDGVTVFGAGDAGSVFRVLNEDNVSDGSQIQVTKSTGTYIRPRLSIGQNSINTSYTLYVNGNAYFTGQLWTGSTIYSYGFYHRSYGSADYLLTSNGGAVHKTAIGPYGYVMKETLVDLSSLNGNTYYPVTFSIGAHSNVRIEVRVSLNTGKTDSNWMTHSSGFSCRAIWEVNGSGWGTNNIDRTIYAYDSAFTNIGNPCGEIGQMSNSSTEYIYLRGHAKYYIYTSHNVDPVLRTSTYTTNGQSIGTLSSINTDVSTFGTYGGIFQGLSYSGSTLSVTVGGYKRTCTINSSSTISKTTSLSGTTYVAGTSSNQSNFTTCYYVTQFYFTSSGAYHSSDARKKYDIRDILNEDVNKLFETENGFIRHYKWKSTNKDAYGFIAQELQEYCPEAVDFNNDDGYYAVNYNVAFSKIIGAMFKKIKELERKLKENGIS